MTGGGDHLDAAIASVRRANSEGEEVIRRMREELRLWVRRMHAHGHSVAGPAEPVIGAVTEAGRIIHQATHDEIVRLEEHQRATAPAPSATGPAVAVVRPAPVVRVPRVVGVEVHPLTALFNAYGNDNSSAETWTGADSTYSVELPDGRILWIFSDTYLGTVNPDGSRPRSRSLGGTTPMVNNTFVVQDGTRFRTITGGIPGAPDSLLTAHSLRGDHVYWAGDAQLHDGAVEIAYRRYEAGTRAVGVAILRLDPDDLRRPVARHDVPTRQRTVSWASALHRTDTHTYVYGSRDTGTTKYLRIARVEGPSMFGAWEYLDAAGNWTSDEFRAADHLAGVANEFSVTPIDGGYLLLTHDTTEVMSADIVGYAAPTPYGPFEDKIVLYTTPETGVAGTYRNPNVYTHNSHAHPHLDRAPGRLVVSYNVHSWAQRGANLRQESDLFDDVSIYRPRFVTIGFEV